MSLKYSIMNTTATAPILTESPLVMPEVNVSQLPMDAATYQDLCRHGESSTYSCHQYQQKFFFMRASDTIGFLIAEGVFVIIDMPPHRLIHVASSYTIGSPGVFSFSFPIIKRCLEGGGLISAGSMFNTPFLITYTMQSLCIPHAVPHSQKWRTIFSDTVISVRGTQ